jgi:hypothetical protein
MKCACKLIWQTSITQFNLKKTMTKNEGFRMIKRLHIIAICITSIIFLAQCSPEQSNITANVEAVECSDNSSTNENRCTQTPESLPPNGAPSTQTPVTLTATPAPPTATTTIMPTKTITPIPTQTPKPLNERNRVQIINNNVVADNGQPLRGEHIVLTFNQDPNNSLDGYLFDEMYDQSLWYNKRDNFNLNTVRLLISRPPTKLERRIGRQLWATALSLLRF